MPDEKQPIEADFHEEGREVSNVDPANIGMVTRTEIDQQIATANKWPRSVTKFQKEARELVTLTEATAQQCIYALPRKEFDSETGRYVQKNIEGPSARFAEILMYCWRNARAGARIVDESAHFITAQGVFQDVERNFAITFEVPRRISGKNNKRYSVDMIGVTGNAAASIALRNAILKGIPKALWEPLYSQARRVVAGDVHTLSNKRAKALEEFAIFGVYPERICKRLGRAGIADIGVDDLVILAGCLTAIRDDNVAPESVFPEIDEEDTVVQGPKAKAPPAENGASAVQGTDGQPSPTQPPGGAANSGAAVAAKQATAAQESGNGTASVVANGGGTPDDPRGQGYVTAGALNMLRNKAKNVGKSGGDICHHFNIDMLRDLTVDQGNEALTWLRTFSG